jgi:predicted Zn-dependent protease
MMQYRLMRLLKIQIKQSILTSIGLLLLAACTLQQPRLPPGTVPVAYVPTITEENRAQEIFVGLKEDYPLDATSLHNDELQGMFNNLASAAGIKAVNWNVHLFDDPKMVDVRAIRGNHIFVWSGVFDVVDSKDEIAGLLACEIAHGLARHNHPVEFNMATEIMFGVTDVTASLGLMILSQGAIAVNGTGMSRWLYVQAADFDDLDRVYDEQQVQEMADIAVNILAHSSYSPAALLSFWKRAEADTKMKRRVKRLSRKVSPSERVVYLETAMQGMPLEQVQAAEPATVEELASLSGNLL